MRPRTLQAKAQIPLGTSHHDVAYKFWHIKSRYVLCRTCLAARRDTHDKRDTHVTTCATRTTRCACREVTQQVEFGLREQKPPFPPPVQRLQYSCDWQSTAGEVTVWFIQKPERALHSGRGSSNMTQKLFVHFQSAVNCMSLSCFAKQIRTLAEGTLLRQRQIKGHAHSPIPPTDATGCLA